MHVGRAQSTIALQVRVFFLRIEHAQDVAVVVGFVDFALHDLESCTVLGVGARTVSVIDLFQDRASGVFDVFEGEAYFPLVLGFIGLSVVILAVLYQKYGLRLFRRG